jgi:signal peptidase II
VIDFIAFHIRDGFRWPTFNVADAAIVVGVAMLLIDSIRGWLRERKAKKAAK